MYSQDSCMFYNKKEEEELLCLQFFEVDLPQVSQKKVDLVDAVIPDKQKVSALLLHIVCGPKQF